MLRKTARSSEIASFDKFPWCLVTLASSKSNFFNPTNPVVLKSTEPDP